MTKHNSPTSGAGMETVGWFYVDAQGQKNFSDHGRNTDRDYSILNPVHVVRRTDAERLLAEKDAELAKLRGEMRRSLNTGPGRWVYTNTETYQRMRDSWLERNPTPVAPQAVGEAVADRDFAMLRFPEMYGVAPRAGEEVLTDDQIEDGCIAWEKSEAKGLATRLSIKAFRDAASTPRAAVAGQAVAVDAAAQICERLATMMEQGAGEPGPGTRLRQAARAIRDLSAPPAPEAKPETVVANRISESRILQIANEWAKSPGWCDFERNDFICCVRAIVSESISTNQDTKQ